MLSANPSSIPAAPGGTIVTPLQDRFEVDITYQYDSRGRLSSVSGTSGSASYSFDANGNLVTISSSFSPSLALSESGETIPSGGGNFVFGVLSNASWRASSNSAWLSVVHLTGFGNGTVAISAASNPGTSPRTGIVSVTGRGLARSYTVKQSGTAPVGVTKATNPSPPPGASGVALNPTFYFTPGQNAAVQILQIGEDPFLFPTIFSETLPGTATSFHLGGLTLSENTTYYWRVITRNAENDQDVGDLWSFTTGGAGSFVNLSPPSRSVSANQTDAVVSVSSNSAWDVVSLADWILVGSAGGTGNGSVPLTVLANPGVSERTGQVVIGGQAHTVHQAAGSTNFGVLTTGSYSSGGQVGGGSTLWRRFTLSSWSHLDLRAVGSVGTVGGLYDSEGTRIDPPSASNGSGFRHTGILGPGEYFVEIEGTSEAGLTTLSIEAHTGLVLQPDKLVGRSPNRLAGDNLYGLSLRAQRLTVATKGTRSLVVAGALENDAAVAQTIQVAGTRGDKSFAARYLYQGSNVTSAVVSGRYRPHVDAAQRLVMRFHVKPNNRLARRKATKRFMVTATSAHDPGRRDRIEMVIVKRR